MLKLTVMKCNWKCKVKVKFMEENKEEKVMFRIICYVKGKESGTVF